MRAAKILATVTMILLAGQTMMAQRTNAKTWADYITYDMESNPLYFRQLRDFMRGVADGGPTPSGHRTPTVIVVLPVFVIDPTALEANAWMVQQTLAQGVHGLILPRARNPEAVKHFVRAARYPIAKQGADVLGIGTREKGRRYTKRSMPW